jgi:ketosteroid isomerase-like protein
MTRAGEGRGILRAVVTTLAVPILLTACQSDTSTAADTSREAELEALTAAALAYQAAASAKDSEAVVAMYDETAIMIPPNAEIVDEGLQGVQNYQFGFIVTPGVELDFELIRVEVAASGDIGWTFAIGDITIHRDGEEPGRDVVRDFHTWKKQADGSWKIVVDLWNSGMPAG